LSVPRLLCWRIHHDIDAAFVVTSFKFVVDIVDKKMFVYFSSVSCFIGSVSFRFVMMMVQIIFGGSARVDKVNYKKWWR
jgi:hypothetical protein